MAYDETLAARIRAMVAAEGTIEKKGFGGLMFLIGGNMAVAAGSKGALMVRCAPADSDALVAAGAERMVMRGKPTDGWLNLDPELLSGDADLRRWVDVGVRYARSLPPK